MAVISVSTLHYLSFLGYPDLWNGDTANGTSSASAALQAAINDCDGVLDLAPGATYLIDDAVTLKSGLHIRGNGATLLAHASCTALLSYVADGLADLTIETLNFDGTATYPEDETADKWDLSPVTVAIRLSGANFRRIKILDCNFEKISSGSIYITSVGGKDIIVERCHLVRGFFFGKGISVYADNGSSEASRCTVVKIVNNHLEHGGPTAYVDAADEVYINSSDAIHLDGCGDVVVTGNNVEYAAGDGIRIEQTARGEISGNKVREAGYNGVNIYASCENISVIGNQITSWGRLPYAGALYNYNGTLVIPREAPHATLAQFPADPTASSWWEEWPYTTTGMDTETIRDYDDRSYYAGVSDGSLPFRGYYGIGYVQSSKNCTVIGNICIPDLTTDAGKYTHASDFGFASTHYINLPVDSSSLPLGVIDGNIFGGRVEDVYTPDYCDPLNERGPMGTRVVGANPTP